MLALIATLAPAASAALATTPLCGSSDPEPTHASRSRSDEIPIGATCLAAHASEDALAIGGHGGVALVVEGRREPLPLPMPSDFPRNVFALAFAGDVLIEVGGAAARHADVRAWRWRTHELLWEQRGGTDLLYSVAIANGRIYAGGADSKIAVLSLASGELQTTLEGHTGAVLALAASPDGTTLVSAGIDRSLRVWDLPSHALVRAIHNHNDAVNDLSWSPDGRYLASASSDRTVRIFQPRIGRLVRIVQAHDAPVLSVAYTPQGLWSGTQSGLIHEIEPHTDRILATHPAHTAWAIGLAATPQALHSLDDQSHLLRWTPTGPIPVLD